ncbi:MAG: hypothetical protein ABI797_08475, partial [Chloroflexota bacterium]
LAPLAIAVIWLGVLPTPVLNSLSMPVRSIVITPPAGPPAAVEPLDEVEQTSDKAPPAGGFGK